MVYVDNGYGRLAWKLDRTVQYAAYRPTRAPERPRASMVAATRKLIRSFVMVVLVEVNHGLLEGRINGEQDDEGDEQGEEAERVLVTCDWYEVVRHG